MLNPFGSDGAKSSEDSNIEPAQSLALTIESECEVVEDLCEDYDLFGDHENYDQLSDYIVEPGSKAYLTLSDGKFQHKANAINSLLYKSTKLRTIDRLFRVKEKITNEWDENDVFRSETRENCIRLTDLILTIICFKSGGIGAVLVSINRIKINGEYVYFVDNKDFNLATFFGRVMKFDKPISNHNIIWSSSYADLIEVKGKDSIQFDIHTSEIDNKITSYIPIKSLAEAMKIMQSIYEGYESKPLFHTIYSPYSNEIQEHFKLVSLAIFVQGDKPPCKICKKNIEISLMRLHVGKHILSGQVSAEVCGFCGTNCNSPVSLRLTSGSQKNGTYKAHSNCAYIKDFNIGSCIKLSANNPCSNRPVRCDLCVDSFVWSYGLELHYSDKHQGITCPIIVSDEEKQAVLAKKQ